MIKYLRRNRNRRGNHATATVFAEALERRRMFDMLYPGDGPAPEEHHDEPVAYTLGSKWATTKLSYSFSNLLNGGLAGGLSATVLEAAIEEALQVWSAVAPMQFTEVVDSGPQPTSDDFPYTAGSTPQLRFGHHYIDGGEGANVLAHAYYPSSNGIGGDLHFDSSNVWSTHPSRDVDIIEVATHEIGHALGIAHEETNDAIMNPYYGARYSGPGSAFLLQDDINAVRAHYGTGLGYVISDGTLFLSGTASADALGVDISGTTFTLSNGTRTVTGSTSGITHIVVNARGGNDTITIGRTGTITVAVNGGTGTDALTVSDKNGTFAGTYTTNAASVSRTGMGDVSYAATESLALEGSNSNNTFTVNTGGAVTIRTNGGSDVVNVNTDNSGTAAVIFDQPNEHVTTLTLGNGGKATLKSTTNPMDNVLTVSTLNLSPAAMIDLTNGGMIVDFTSSSPIMSLSSGLASAYSFGEWSGNGITSSLIAAASPGVYTIGIGHASDVLYLAPSEQGEWYGHAVDGTAVLIRFTYAGDVDLNGYVDAVDYGTIDNWIQLEGTNGYTNGDINFDGVIDAVDYGIIDYGMQMQGAAL